MIIALTGVQSAGKTTLLQALQDDFSNRGIPVTVVSDMTRDLHRLGKPINDYSSDYNETQRLIIQGHIDNIENLKKYSEDSSIVILDRCMLDGALYTDYFFDQNKVTKDVRDFGFEMLETFWKMYRFMFYLNPGDVPLVDDKVRSTNVDFRNAMIQKFNMYNPKYNVITISGSVKDRVNVIKRYL